MSLDVFVWAYLLLFVCGSAQLVIYGRMLKEYHKDQASQLEVMASLLVSMQSSSLAAHSRRVADISEKLALEMRLPAKRLPIIRAAALLHDIEETVNIPGHLPIERDILAVADYFDGITQNCNLISLDNAMAEMQREAGIRFPPNVVKALMKTVMRSGGGTNSGN